MRLRLVGTLHSLCLVVCFGFCGFPLALPQLARAQPNPSGIDTKIADAFRQLPPPQLHYDGITANDLAARQRREGNYQSLLREKIKGDWFAALVSDKPGEENQIVGRFETWKGLMDFLLEKEALVEVWAYPEPGLPPRRIPATEMAALKKQPLEPPTFITVRYLEGAELRGHRVEFGFGAAERTLAATRGYERHRAIQRAAQEALSARDEQGKLSAVAQWEALVKALLDGRLPLRELPAVAGSPADLFVALEYEVDEFNNFVRIVRVYRESEIERRILTDSAGRSEQVLVVKKPNEAAREAHGFRVKGVSDELEPAPSPVLGQEVVELRVKNPAEPDVRKWNVLEFGEPEILKESALAKFSLVSAHLERQRKAIAVKKSNIDIIVEPIIAGVNVGGGFAGWGVPAGEAIRLAYNLITPHFIADVPTVKELRELFLLLAAKEKHPELKTKPAHFLSPEDIRVLQSEMQKLSPAEIQTYLENISDHDLEAMIVLARMQRIDARVSNFLNILTSAAKVSGEAETGLLREIFNNSYVSLSGDVSIKNIIAALMGEKLLTPRHSISLKDLAEGRGPAKAWAQYFDFSVDLRAVVNTVSRIPKKTFAEKELNKPFPYAFRMSDLAAYEVRIFGFPLFIFYKRGLLKDDFAAYQNDYAYGIDGPNIVEHFKTKEEMDVEIRAGRMSPAGYVRVPDGKGGWRDSNLAVFVHRRPTEGKKVRMLLIIYGLKAYADHAEFMGRERKRFEAFERALHEGGVIETVVDAENRAQLSSAEFEPTLFAGPEAADERYAPLLGALLELRRYWQYRAWGLQLETNEVARLNALYQDLAKKSIWFEKRDPLVGVDRFNSTFLYRRLVEGKWRVVKLTLIPGPEDVRRDLAKAETGERIERLRHEAVSTNGVGIAFLNTVRQVEGHAEIGPLWADQNGVVLGHGVRSGAAALEEMLEKLNQLSAAERVRLERNHFAASLVELDVDGDGRTEKVFLTLEFPLGERLERESVNPISGEREVMTFANGRVVAQRTEQRIVEIDRDANGLETRSRVFFNAGTRAQPNKGALIEETQTLEHWLRDSSRANVDPALPVLVRWKANHVTGQMALEMYGLPPLPLVSVDDQFVTANQYNAFGIFESAHVFDNGASDADFLRPELARVLNPIVGRERFVLTSQIPAAQLATLRDLKAQSFQTAVERRDVVKGLVKTWVLDNARFGRKASERFTDAFDGTTSFAVSAVSEYRDDFYFGLLPFRTLVSGAAGGATISDVQTIEFEPVSRKLTALVTDHTGRSGTNVWDYRWENPVAVETALRRTTNQFDRMETSLAGATIAKSSGETVSVFMGRFEPATSRWQVGQTWFHQPGVTNRTEMVTRSGFGKLIATRAGNLFEAHPVYGGDGIERTNRITRWNPASGQFDRLHRVEDDFQWERGERNARVQTFVDGGVHDTFRCVTDAEGRMIVDGVRQWPGVELETLVAYEGATERTTRTEEWLNNQLRVTRDVLPPQRQPDGAWWLPLRITPQWGLSATQTFVLGDALARPVSTVYESGERVNVTEWFDGTSVARVSELIDRHGRPRERYVRRLNAGTNDAVPFDATRRYKLNDWGAAGLAEEEAAVRGTDVTLFSEAAEERTYFDLTRPYKAPRFTVDAGGENGIVVALGPTRRANVLTVFDSRIVRPPVVAGTNQPRLTLEKIDLGGLFFHKFTRQTLDRGGKILDETIGRIANQGETNYTHAALFSAASQAKPTKEFHYRYNAGWILEKQAAAGGGRSWIFSPDPPPAGSKGLPVNDGGRRELVTQIDGRQTPSEEPLESAGASTYLFHRSHSPRELERNPYMPARTDAWTAWTTTDLRPDGQTLFESETIYDAEGRLCVAKAVKTAGSSGLGTKISYTIPPPPPGAWKELTLQRGEQIIPLDAAGRQDFSGSDFVYLHLQPASNISLVIADVSGKKVRVGRGPPQRKERLVSPWPVSSANVRWLPDAVVPRQGTVVTAPASLLSEGGVLVVSVHDLAQAGLDVERLSAFSLLASNGVEMRATVSPLYPLTRGDRFVEDDEAREFAHETQRHSNGLKTFTSAPRQRTERQVYGGVGMNSVTELNGLPVAITRSRAAASEYPHLVIVDNSDPDAPRPLYALSPNEGRFLEHYKLLKLGRSQVYTIVQGFELPRLEVFDSAALEDEISPGFIAYGNYYQVSINYSRASGFVGHALASLQNRIVANGFKYGGERFLRRMGGDHRAPEFASHFDYAALHDATTQAEEINRLPTLAQMLLGTRELPWDSAAAVRVQTDEDWGAIKLALQKLHLQYEATGLIPTAPGTAAERYAETTREGDLIVLAIKLGETGLARELLDFYWEKSRGGQVALHASYDAQAGTAMTADLLSARPMHARRTAEAQVAIADAAFALGVESGDAKWVTLGKNLLDLLLEEFRPPPITNGAPRGIAEFQYLPKRRAYGLTLWPPAETYPLGCNARIYLLLRQLNQLLAQPGSDNLWRFQIGEALAEQEAWLRTYIVPAAEQSGVVPRGLFEVQDINRGTTALALQRWTASEDWLWFLEAAHAMGVAPETTRRWLENLARVHGVRVNDRWGLDWSIPLLRADAISPELTARFQRVAKLIAHEHAEAFGSQSVRALKQGGIYPVVVTEAEPRLALQTGQGFALFPQTNRSAWPNAFSTYREMTNANWDLVRVTNAIAAKRVEQVWTPQSTDLTVFIFITAGFYLSILVSAIFWWRFRALRGHEHGLPDPLVPEPVLERAEERWAKRVLGVQTPAGAEQTRFSNAPVEHNFLMQLRAMYKLIAEWRRQENGWTEDDPRVAEDESDGWLNGIDEFASVVGIYMRWVIKAGAKDGFDQKEVLLENEDSNHIWSRLVMFFSEYYWGVLTVMRNYNNLVTQQDKANVSAQMAQLLSSIGIRQRPDPFDARKLFNYPVDPGAMDLLVIQQPGMTLDKLLIETSNRLRIPYLQMVRFVERYKEFKRREHPYPLHPYLIEFAKVLPHFLLMGLGALIWYNQSIGDSPIVPYLGSVLAKFALSPASLIWALPLLGSLVLGVIANFTRVYRYEAPMLQREKTELFLDATLTSLFVKRHSIMPKSKESRWWDPDPYEWGCWGLRAAGFFLLGLTLLRLETPSFATFLVVKGILAMLAFAEVAAVLLPLVASAISKFLQDWVTRHPDTNKAIHFVNHLNITATRPASPLWLSIKYHTAPSVPTGGFWGMTQAIVFYFVLAAVFFFVGGYLCQQIFSLWFMDTYLNASDWKLLFGSLLFWNTMYLLRYGLFLFFTGLASALATFRLKAVFGTLALIHILLTVFGPALQIDLGAYPDVTYALMGIGLVLMLLEEPLGAWFRRIFEFDKRAAKRQAATRRQLADIQANKSAQLGVVYMSGDDLSAQKLNPELLMTRWELLRDKLDSRGIRLLCGMAPPPDDAALKQGFQALLDAEKKADVTLWSPLQLVVEGEPPHFASDLALSIVVESTAAREQLLVAWHLRRWLVSMMSTAGHSQDTAINLVDIALRLEREGLSGNTSFFLIQNKYDNNETNRPSQTPYDRGELGHRNKLARLLCAVAPGTRAYSLQNWTPFGFKAGGLTGMDLVHEETLKLTTMILLDRNATVHDLDALMEDVTRALTDPDVVIIVPGRSTTNTLTALGQGSQMVEEGHRSFLKGLMAMLGGRASESIGTGWGNILAFYQGRVQRAMVDGHSPKMPLTSRMRRGSSFAVRVEGLIGFAPHAVGISEDIWAVTQTAHNAIALGRRVKFFLSRAMWHKIRETWSHSEWLASFPRWSGGFLQMMHDPIMQRINDFGPMSIFAKEVRANSGRNFLTAPFALLNILLMPLAIMLDVTPFIQILIVLWNFGFIMNQILTVHGLNTYMESAGFYRLPALLGGIAAGALCLTTPALQSWAPGMVIVGFLAGGFLVGLSRWLYTRVRDMVLFGPQLVLHALGQVVRQTLEFVVSGASPEDAKSVNMAFRAWAGPREDRPLDMFPHIINLRTVVWMVGLTSVILNLFALSNLDMLNVLLLLPSLLFSVSTLIGPFVLKPRVGCPSGKHSGQWVLVSRLLGWAASIGLYTAISLLIAQRGLLKWLGIVLFAAVFGVLLQRVMRYATYRRRMARARRSLTGSLTAAGLPLEEAPLVAQRIVAVAADSAKVRGILEKVGVAPEDEAALIDLVQRKLAPMLQEPRSAGAPGGWRQNYFVSEAARSFVLALFILIWFFVVPVPGLFVFTAGKYRISMRLGAVLLPVFWGVGIVIVAAWLGRFIQWVHWRVGRRGLQPRIIAAYKALQSAVVRPGTLKGEQIAGAYALFTDIQTYVDQRGYEYASRAVRRVEDIIEGKGAVDTPHGTGRTPGAGPGPI